MIQKRLFDRLSFVVVLIASVIFIYYPITIMHLDAFLTNNIVAPNTRLAYLCHKLSDPELFASDYITQYLERQNKPVGYTLIINFLSEITGLFLANKLLAILLIYTTMIAVAIAAWRLGGAIIAWSATTFAYVFPFISYYTVTNIPQMFAFPLLSWFFVAMVFGRVYLMALVTILGAVLYMPVSIITGAVMAGYLLIMPESARGSAQNWSFVIRFSLLSFCGLIVLINIFYSLQPIEGYGDYIKPYTDVENYPETGKGGQYFIGINIPILFFIMKFVGAFTSPNFIVLVIFVQAFIFGLCKKNYLKSVVNDNRENSWHRLMIYIISVLSLSIAAYVFALFYSYRFFLYGLFLFSLTVVPLMIFVVATTFFSGTKLESKYLPLAIVILTTFAISFSVDIKTAEKYGYVHLPDSASDLFRFAESTPKGALFAGMPGLVMEALDGFDYLPYFSKRPVLLGSVTHIVFHKDYILEMRARMNAIIDAYYSSDLGAIKALHDKYKVDYFIVNKKWYEEKPNYFAPFDERIDNSFKQAQEVKPFFLDNIDKAVMKSGDIYVFDLKKLVGG